MISPPVIIVQADRFALLRCRCPQCLVLDARHPGEGFQLALFPYRISTAPPAAIEDPRRRFPATGEER